MMVFFAKQGNPLLKTANSPTKNTTVDDVVTSGLTHSIVTLECFDKTDISIVNS